MPSLITARKISSLKNNNANSIGQIHKENSDFIMEQTWDSDIQSKVCYIYDFFHDNQQDLNKHMTYENTTKTIIDAKFIVTTYGSMDKDQVAYHLMFKPSQNVEFNENDELYYFEKNYRKRYDVTFPIGLYVDIPDEKGVYTKWLICDFEEGNQFTKYTVLPCDYRFQWISIENGKHIKRQIWGCTRGANSYTSGLWIDRYIQGLDDINKFIIPLNDFTSYFGHLKENGENQRIIISAKTDNPLTFKVSKIENTKPIGLIKATLKEDVFDTHTDYIEKDDDGNIIGMWANYYDSEFNPITPEENVPVEQSSTHCMLSTSSYSIKNSGGYKKIVSTYLDESEEDISVSFANKDRQYFYEINGTDVSEFVTFIEQTDKNILKLKFNNNDYIGSILTIRTIVDNICGEIKLEII